MVKVNLTHGKCHRAALAAEPQILLMDEPASALDPIATQRTEELIYQLKSLADVFTRTARPALVKKLIDIPRMATIAQRMLRDALDAFVRRDTELAQQVLNEDDALDALKTQIFRHSRT